MPARTQKKALDAGHHSDPGGNSWKILFFRRMLPEIVSMKKMWILRGFKKNPVIYSTMAVGLLGGYSCLGFCYGGDPKILVTAALPPSNGKKRMATNSIV